MIIVGELHAVNGHCCSVYSGVGKLYLSVEMCCKAINADYSTEITRLEENPNVSGILYNCLVLTKQKDFKVRALVELSQVHGWLITAKTKTPEYSQQLLHNLMRYQNLKHNV